MSIVVRVLAAIVLLMLGIAFVVVTLGVRPSDLTWLLYVLTGGAFLSLLILGHAAIQPPRIDALSERTFIALLIFGLGLVSCLIVYNTDNQHPLFDAATASLLFRLAILGVLSVPTIWLALYLVGRLGRTGKG